MKHKSNEISVVTHSKARLGQRPGLGAFPRHCKGNHLRRVDESRHSNAVVAGHEEVGSLSTTFASVNGVQSPPGFGIFKCEDVLPVLNMLLNINLSITLHKKI